MREALRVQRSSQGASALLTSEVGALRVGALILALCLWLGAQAPHLIIKRVCAEEVSEELPKGAEGAEGAEGAVGAEGPLEPLKGAALTLYGELPELGMTYSNLLREIKREGFSHVSLVTHWAQRDIKSVTLAPHPRETLPEPALRRVIQEAHALGLRVMLFPIIWLERRGEGEWRGRLSPSDPGRWWRSYERFVLWYAKLAQEEGVWGLIVGSELSSQEGEVERWRALIKRVRLVYQGLLTYSANWDHFDHVSFWDQLDMIGVSAYYEVASSPISSAEEMRQRWAHVRWSLLEWQARAHPHRPLLFTELGYPSHAEGAMKPWHESASAELGLEAQRRAFQAFREVWNEEPHLLGAFVWSWWGPGGAQDLWYTLKGKPALREVRAWLKKER